ncbi:hypothetical protein LOTGIDRAFT_161042 [Lottia gigantea]|uniref:Uncharacterized protein n=1 Tax=Lottia gigantea TaxID=225164 RepID=V4AMD7_LOTGI|nr:hypothetical protein LOTGIDRAFT_161042 [Lottia gigantea]ESO94791.1 hypothetical protein LOTGIDRAFT_161042 [Lottia gigantea]
MSSFNSIERCSRGSGQKRLIKGVSTVGPEDWKEFLTNDDNKQELIKLLIQIWSDNEFSHKIQEKLIIVVWEGEAYKHNSRDGETVNKSPIQSLSSKKKQTQIVYCLYAEEHNFDYVQIKSPDRDVFYILLYYASHLKVDILLDIGNGSQSNELNESLLALHALTRCDRTSAFKGIGKRENYKVVCFEFDSTSTSSESASAFSTGKSIGIVKNDSLIVQVQKYGEEFNTSTPRKNNIAIVDDESEEEGDIEPNENDLSYVPCYGSNSEDFVSDEDFDVRDQTDGISFLDEVDIDSRMSHQRTFLIYESSLIEILSKVTCEKCKSPIIKRRKSLIGYSLTVHGSLEVFHSMMLKYLPKRQEFDFACMMARTQLAALDHNHNVDREIVLEDSKPKYRPAYSKKGKQWVVKPIYESKYLKRKTC